MAQCFTKMVKGLSILQRYVGKNIDLLKAPKKKGYFLLNLQQTEYGAVL